MLTHIKKVELEDLIEFSKTIKVLYVEDECKLRESAYGVFKIFFENIILQKTVKKALINSKTTDII